MINSLRKNYQTEYYGINPIDYIHSKRICRRNFNIFITTIVITILATCFIISKPIFATSELSSIKQSDTGKEIYLQKNFEENIKNKYGGSYINFPAKGIAHIKKVKYINSKPIRINIVEINTNVNQNLKVKPQIASYKLNSKTTVRRIAQRENSIIAINGSFFKPQTGAPLGALMINGEVLSGPIYNRVGMAIFENEGKTSYKMANIAYDINAITPNFTVKIDNINQPRMLSTHTLVYTSSWANNSPPPPQNGYNLVIRNNKPVKISANPVAIEQNDYVIQGNKDTIIKLAKQGEIKVKIDVNEELKEAKHFIGAGPYLVKNSEVYVDYKEQKLQAISGKNPRSAVGYTEDGTLIILTIDGREQSSVGMTLYELAKYMKSLGCKNAMNFDGGSSSAMYIKGKIVNSAVNKEGIAVSNALVVNESSSDNIQISSL